MFKRISCILLIVCLSTPAWSVEASRLVVAKKHLSLKISSDVVDEVGPGQVLRVLRSEGKYFWVSRGQPGWVYQNDVIDLEDAEPYFQRAFATGAGSQDYLARGTVRIALGKHSEGIDDLLNAMRLAEEPGEYLEAIAYAQLTAQDQPSAIKTFTRTIGDNPTSAAALMGRGLAYYQVGQNRNAYSDLTAAIKLEPTHAFPRKYLGVLLHDEGKLELAREQLEKAREIDEYDAFVRKSLGRLFYDFRDYDAALMHFEFASSVAPDDLEAIAGRGLVLHAIGEDLRRSLTAFERAIELSDQSPDDAFLWNNLGQVQAELGMHEAALQSLNRAIDLDPELHESLSHRAHLIATEFGSATNIERAKSDLRKVFSSTDPKTYWDYRALAAVNATMGDYERAARFQTLAKSVLKQTAPVRYQADCDALIAKYAQKKNQFQ